MLFDVMVHPERPSATKQPFYDTLEKFVDASNKDGPAGLKNLKQGSESWTFMPTEK